MQNQHKFYGPYEKYIKRPMDGFLAVFAIILLSPVFLIIAALVRFKLGSPVLFIQNRLGLEGRNFKLYKFRSMADVKDLSGRLLSDDERLTKFGRILRSTSLDELPELFNIVKGDMAIIGPRPLLVEYLPYYTKEEMHRHDVRPGLSGLAQVHGRNTIFWEEKFAWDLKYVKKITFFGDMKIVFKTVIKVLRHSDILVGKQHKIGRLDDVREDKKCSCRKVQ